MTPQQKTAWFNLVLFLVTLTLYLTGVPTLAWLFHRPWSVVAGPALGIFGLLGFWGIAPRLIADNSRAFDERDRDIALKAWRTGMGTFWVLFVLGCVGAWGLLRYLWGLERITVPVEIFPWIVGASLIIAIVAQSVATLHLYGWRHLPEYDGHAR